LSPDVIFSGRCFESVLNLGLKQGSLQPVSSRWYGPQHELAHVKLIFLREVLDQLRDRRTLFMVAVLPLLLYPLLGIACFR